MSTFSRLVKMAVLVNQRRVRVPGFNHNQVETYLLIFIINAEC